MSAINVIKFPDGVHVATDSAAWDASGTVTAFVHKSFALPHFPAVIATRGAAITPLLFGWAFTKEFSSFDDMVARIDDEMPEIHEILMPDLGEHGEGFDLVIAGYSEERKAFEFYTMTTLSIADRGYSDEESAEVLAAGALDQKPYQLVEIKEPLLCSPAILSEDEIAATGLNQRVANLGRQAQIDETFRTVLEMQRQKPFNFMDCDEPFHGIGGRATVCTVTKTGVDQRVIHRWRGDRIGELIKPEPVDWSATVTPINTAGMSRQQRRYLERQAKKKRA